MKTLLLSIFLAVQPGVCMAFCFQPTPPFSQPSPPYCFDNVCDSWTVDSYRADVEQYIFELETYQQQAADYAACAADEAIDEWNDFVATHRVKR